MGGLVEREEAVSRDFLMSLQDQIAINGADEAVVCGMSHFFAPGTYGRQISIPGDTFVVGKIHKHSHLNVLLSGTVRVASEFHIETFSAPRVWISEPGIKRVIYTYTDSEWLTIHPNPDGLETPDEMEAQVIAENYEELDRRLEELL